MQIVIDIDDRVYKNLMTDNGWRAIELAKAIKNGTPLPKGHGRLIDADELKKIIKENDTLTMTGFSVRLCDIDNAPTIIEANEE